MQRLVHCRCVQYLRNEVRVRTAGASVEFGVADKKYTASVIRPSRLVVPTQLVEK
jgi:hypothetical protein